MTPTANNYRGAYVQRMWKLHVQQIDTLHRFFISSSPDVQCVSGDLLWSAFRHKHRIHLHNNEYKHKYIIKNDRHHHYHYTNRRRSGEARPEADWEYTYIDGVVCPRFCCAALLQCNTPTTARAQLRPPNAIKSGRRAIISRFAPRAAASQRFARLWVCLYTQF